MTGNVIALLALTLPTMLYSLLFFVMLALIVPQKVFSKVGWLAWLAITPLAILVPVMRVTEENEPLEGPEVFLVPQPCDHRDVHIRLFRHRKMDQSQQNSALRRLIRSYAFYAEPQ